MGLPYPGANTSPDYGLLILIIPFIVIALIGHIVAYFIGLTMLNKLLKTNIKRLVNSFILGLITILNYLITIPLYKTYLWHFYDLASNASFQSIPFSLIFAVVSLLTSLIVATFTFRKDHLQIRSRVLAVLVIFLISYIPALFLTFYKN
jgi:hypothetical protein